MAKKMTLRDASDMVERRSGNEVEHLVVIPFHVLLENDFGELAMYISDNFCDDYYLDDFKKVRYCPIGVGSGKTIVIAVYYPVTNMRPSDI